MWTRMMDGDSVISKKVDKPSTLFIIMVLAFTVAAIYSQALSSIGGALTPVDATTTVLSIIATCFMVKGYREQWVCWIIVNLLSIYMWSMTIINTGEGVGVLVMWVMFLSNSIYGTYTWFKASQSQETK